MLSLFTVMHGEEDSALKQGRSLENIFHLQRFVKKSQSRAICAPNPGEGVQYSKDPDRACQSDQRAKNEEQHKAAP